MNIKRTNIMRFGLIAMVLISLQSCGVMKPYKMADEGVKRAQDNVNKSRDFGDEESAVYTSSQRVDLTPIVQLEGPEWLDATVQRPLHVSQLPLDMAVDLLLKGTGVVIRFDSTTNPGLKVNLVHEGSIRVGLDKLAAYTNYSFKASDSTIDWHAYETQVYRLPVSGGDYSYLIGKEKPREDGDQMGQQGSGGVDTSAFDVDRKQFSSTLATDLNFFDDAENTISRIVGDYGVITTSKSSSTIVVKTTPDRMKTVNAYMSELMDSLNAQVLLELRVVQVTSQSKAQAGINWAAVKETTRSQLNFIGEVGTSAFSNTVPVAFSGVRNNSSGSVEAMLSALEEQGNVSFLTEQRVLSPSGRVSELEIGDIQGYLAQSQTTNTTDVGSSIELVPGILQGGYTLYTLSHVIGDQISMIISTRDSIIEPFETIGTDSNFIQLPRMKSNRLNLQQIVTDGTTVVAAAVRREENMRNENSPLRTGLASTYADADSVVTDIIVMITPRIVRGI